MPFLELESSCRSDGGLNIEEGDGMSETIGLKATTIANETINKYINDPRNFVVEEQSETGNKRVIKVKTNPSEEVFQEFIFEDGSLLEISSPEGVGIYERGINEIIMETRFNSTDLSNSRVYKLTVMRDDCWLDVTVNNQNSGRIPLGLDKRTGRQGFDLPGRKFIGLDEFMGTVIDPYYSSDGRLAINPF